jgi:hypothetical protein
MNEASLLIGGEGDDVIPHSAPTNLLRFFKLVSCAMMVTDDTRIRNALQFQSNFNSNESQNIAEFFPRLQIKTDSCSCQFLSLHFTLQSIEDTSINQCVASTVAHVSPFQSSPA